MLLIDDRVGAEVVVDGTTGGVEDGGGMMGGGVGWLLLLLLLKDGVGICDWLVESRAPGL